MHRRTFCASLLVGVCQAVRPGWASPAPAPSRPERTITIVPLGAPPGARSMEGVVAAVTAYFGHHFAITTAPSQPLPRQAYWPARGRYRAERILDSLRAGPERVLGVTSSDISTSKGNVQDWGILGLGDLPGTAAVISSYRTVRRAHSAGQVRQRLAKVAVHELGHTFGLPHCANGIHGCLMGDVRGDITTIDRERDLCGECRRQLARGGLVVPHLDRAPW